MELGNVSLESGRFDVIIRNSELTSTSERKPKMYEFARRLLVLIMDQLHEQGDLSQFTLKMLHPKDDVYWLYVTSNKDSKYKSFAVALQKGIAEVLIGGLGTLTEEERKHNIKFALDHKLTNINIGALEIETTLIHNPTHKQIIDLIMASYKG
jgi:hypothetical protein